MFVLSPEAEEDLWSIWNYLSQEAGVRVADRIEGQIFAAFEMLARAPGVGHRRTDLTNHRVFFFAVYQYLIAYHKSSPLGIAAILHGKRDAERVLIERL